MTTRILDNVKARIDRDLGSGVWASSSEQGNAEYIIFASDLPFEQTVEYLNSHGITFKNLRGAYVMDSTGEQVIEDSFIVNIQHLSRIMVLIQGQESILALGQCGIHGKRPAVLQYLESGHTAGLGYLVSVGKDRAMQEDNWTHCPYMDTYFITEPYEETSH